MSARPLANASPACVGGLRYSMLPISGFHLPAALHLFLAGRVLGRNLGPSG